MNKNSGNNVDYENEMNRYVDTCKWCINAMKHFQMKLADATKPTNEWTNERTNERARQ